MNPQYDEYQTLTFLRSKNFKGNENILEKFVRNFEMHSILADKFDFITRGGMAMPFYQSHGLSRLSEDVDLIVLKNTKEVEEIINGISELPGYELVYYKPKNPSPAPVLTYHAKYNSKLGGTNKIKLDFLCDPNMQFGHTKRFESGFDMIYFKTKHPVTILDLGTLLADKLSSLAMNTIGYGEGKEDRMPKQIFDISILLQESNPDYMEQAVTSFELMTTQKCTYHTNSDKNTWSLSEIVHDILNSLLVLIHTKNSISLSKNAKEKRSMFLNTYLNNPKDYTESKYLDDLLLVLLFVMRLELCINKKLSKKEFALSCIEDIDQIKKYQENDENVSNMDDELLNNLPNLSLKKLASGYNGAKQFLICKIGYLRPDCFKP